MGRSGKGSTTVGWPGWFPRVVTETDTGHEGPERPRGPTGGPLAATDGERRVGRALPRHGHALPTEPAILEFSNSTPLFQAKAAPSEAARSWRGKRRGAADRAVVRVDGLRVYACLAAGAFQYTVSTCTTKLHAGSMSTGSTSIACVPIGASTRRLQSTCNPLAQQRGGGSAAERRGPGPGGVQ